MPFGKQRQREHKRKEEITTSLSHVLAATEKEKRKYKSLDMQDVSRCQSDDEVMQVDNCIPPPNFDMGNKSDNHHVSKVNATTDGSDLLESLSCRLANVEEMVEELRLEIKSTITCRVCYRNAPVDGYSHVNVLGCGHAFCSVCAMSMKHCAICKALVVGKFKLFI